MRGKLCHIWVTLFSWVALYAQDADRYAFASRDITGTARYVSMGGAFAALGGDVSAVADNPAALGVFRRGELSFTVDWQRARSCFDSIVETTDCFRVPQVSWVLSFGNVQRQSGMLFNNLIFQYQRLKTYNRTSYCQGWLPSSQTDLIAELTNGVAETALISGNNVWEDPSVGWLSVMGYDCGVIMPDSDASGVENKWYSVLSENEQVLSALRIMETGAVDAYTFAWGANVSNRFYLGLSLDVLTLSYTKKVGYAEQFALGGGYDYVSTFDASGVGVNFGVGAIWRPVNWLRMGMAFRSPTWMTLRLDDYVEYLDVMSPDYSLAIEHYQLPMQMAAGVAFQFSTKGLLSLEYDYRHQTGAFLSDEHTMKMGGEYVLNRHWFFHAGGAFRSSFGGNDFRFVYSRFDTRTDTEFRNPKYKCYAAIGAGFRNGKCLVDVAYQYTLEHVEAYAHALQVSPFRLNNATHRIVLSLGWTRRK